MFSILFVLYSSAPTPIIWSKYWIRWDLLPQPVVLYPCFLLIWHSPLATGLGLVVSPKLSLPLAYCGWADLGHILRVSLLEGRIYNGRLYHYQNKRGHGLGVARIEQKTRVFGFQFSPYWATRPGRFGHQTTIPIAFGPAQCFCFPSKSSKLRQERGCFVFGTVCSSPGVSQNFSALTHGTSFSTLLQFNSTRGSFSAVGCTIVSCL